MRSFRWWMCWVWIVALVGAGCATSDPELGGENGHEPVADVGDDDTGIEDTGDVDDDVDTGDVGEGDVGEDAGDPDGGSIDLCPGGCEGGEVCTENGCVDGCAQEGYQCGSWTIDGQSVECGSCPSGVCDAGVCADICSEFLAECGTVYWGGQGVDCGSCSGIERCRYNQCAAGQGFVDIAAGSSHTCGLRPNGEVRCWGENGLGQLGNNNQPNNASTPSIVFAVNTAETLSSMNSHTCVTRQDSQVRCWGANGSGRLGNGSTMDAPVPVEVTGVSAAQDVATGGAHTCVRLSNDRLRCWGDNGQGQLGTGESLSNPSYNFDKAGVSLQTGAELDEVWSVSLGAAFSCAVRKDNDTFCWGFNNVGQLGLGDSAASRRFATRLGSMPPAFQVSSGSNHSCAIAVGGGVYCWGRGQEGQIGSGTSNQVSPVAVGLTEGAISVAAGGFHSCAVLETGQVSCWGRNEYGQLGRGSTGTVGAPGFVQGIDNAVRVVAGLHHTCALSRDGQVRCWGRNDSGQLGNGTNAQQSSPVPVSQ